MRTLRMWEKVEGRPESPRNSFFQTKERMDSSHSSPCLYADAIVFIDSQHALPAFASAEEERVVRLKGIRLSTSGYYFTTSGRGCRSVKTY